MKLFVKMALVLPMLLMFVVVSVAQERLPQFLKHKVKPGETINSIAELYNVNKQDMLLLNDFPEEVFLEPNQIILIRQLKDGEEASALPADYKTNTARTTAQPEKKVTAHYRGKKGRACSQRRA